MSCYLEMMQGIKVGDVVAWAEVPLNTMVLWHWESYGDEYHVKNAARTGREKSACVGSIQRTWYSADRDSGNFDPAEPVTIIALGLTGSESAAELQRMANA